MTKKVAVLLSEGFEEAEAVIVIDVLRRMEIEVELLSCQDRLELRSYHQIRMFADALLERRMDQLYDAVVIPGGPQATAAMAENELVVEFIRRHDRAAKLICPLCSAAARAGYQQTAARPPLCLFWRSASGDRRWYLRG